MSNTGGPGDSQGRDAGSAAEPRRATNGAAAKGLAAPPPRWDHCLFWPFWLVCAVWARLWFRLRVEGRLPARGAYVLAANHSSLLDPLVLGACMRRRIVFLMTEVVWRSPWLGWFYRWNRTIPLAVRGGNREAMRAARSVLQQGRVVGIFPEGGLSRDGEPLLGNPGAVSLVLNEGVPIVPVGIVGASSALPVGARWPRPRRISIRFGDPILPDELDALGGGDRRGRLQAATRLIMRRIATLTGHESREAVLESHAALEAAAHRRER